MLLREIVSGVLLLSSMDVIADPVSSPTLFTIRRVIFPHRGTLLNVYLSDADSFYTDEHRRVAIMPHVTRNGFPAHTCPPKA